MPSKVEGVFGREVVYIMARTFSANCAKSPEIAAKSIPMLWGFKFLGTGARALFWQDSNAAGPAVYIMASTDRPQPWNRALLRDFRRELTFWGVLFGKPRCSADI